MVECLDRSVLMLENIRRFHDRLGRESGEFARLVRVNPSIINDPLNYPMEDRGSPLGRRAEHLFALGMSLAAVVSRGPGQGLVRAVAQLMEEFEYLTANAAAQSVKFLRAKNVEDAQRNTLGVSGGRNAAEAVKPQLFKSGKGIAFEFLEIMKVPFELDYGIVVCSLSEILLEMYRQFREPECTVSQALEEAVVKIDERVREMVLRPISSDIKRISTDVAKKELSQVMQEFGLEIGKQAVPRKSRADISILSHTEE